MKTEIPENVDEEFFHDFAHRIAGTLTPPPGLSHHDVGQHIKALILDALPSEYVRVMPYTGINRWFARGKHEFTLPIPRDIFLAAARRAGVIS